MERSFHFVQETSSRHKRKVILTVFITLIVIIGLITAFSTTLYKFFTEAPYIGELGTLVKDEIYSVSPAGLFYAGFFLGLFFVPLPHEPLFYLGLVKGNSILLSVLLLNAGYLLSQAVNYFFGSRLSKIIIHLVSKKGLYKSRRFVNKFGGPGVFIFNVLPLPAPVLTLGLGITKYNIHRLFFYTLLGALIKDAAIIGFFLITN